MAGLSLKALRKSYGAAEIIKGVDLDIAHGEFVVFVGPSGCGKSTLLRMIAGLEDITAGELHIGDRVVNDVEPRDRGIAMVFQSYALYPHMSVYDNVGFGLKLSRTPKDVRDAKIRDAARILQMEHLLERKPAQLSGGQRQRVAIGRAIVRNPEVFLFDEPLSNLDAELRVHMRIEIARLHKELQTTIIYVTHDQVEAMTLADKIVVLRDGLVEQVGRPLDLYDDPANQFVAGFIGSPKMNFIPAKVVEKSPVGITIVLPQFGDARLILPVTGAEVGQDVTLGVRPEHFGPAGAGGADITIDVDVAEHLGTTSYVYARTQGEPLIIEREESRNESGTDRLTVSIDPAKAYLFDKQGLRLR